MGRLKETYMRILATKQTDDDIYRFTLSEIEDKISALTEFIDVDDVVGNMLMSYLIANSEDIADALITKGK
jgi:hypothetical protein